MDVLAAKLRGTRLFRELSGGIGGSGRFDSLSTEVKQLLNRRLTAETMARGAQVARTELKINEVSRALAASVTELTASIDASAAGIRASQFAIATETTAVAGQVTQLEARLQVAVNEEDLLPVPPAPAYANFTALNTAVPAATADTRKYYRVTDGAGEALYRSDGSTWNNVGTQASAKLEEVLLVTADKSLGLESQYTLKVTAGKAIAGFGIAATERDGVPESSFIIQADKFGLTAPYTFVQEATPTATAAGQTWYNPATEGTFRATGTGTGNWVAYTPPIPFGFDTLTGTAYIDGSLRIAGGTGATFTTVNSTAVNFNNRNDRNATAVVAPTILSDGTAVDHTVNTDGSVDISLEWAWPGVAGDIDGFIITLYSAATNAAYTFGTTPAAESKSFTSADKRAAIFYGLAANRFYKFGVQAYRVVDPDIDASGVLASVIVSPSLAAENPYQPSSSVAFAGDITGTLSGTAVATVVNNAATGAAAYSAVYDPTTGLSAKMGNAQKNILSGEGGLKLGTTIDWASDGSSVTGVGIAITSKGIVGRNSGGPTFTLDATNGNAAFAGDISGASGTFGGDVQTAGRLIGFGGNTYSGYLAAVHGIAGTVGGVGVLGLQNVGLTAVEGIATSGYGVIGSAGSAGVGVRATNTGGGVALEILQGYIARSKSYTGKFRVWDTATDTLQGEFYYEFSS